MLFLGIRIYSSLCFVHTICCDKEDRKGERFFTMILPVSACLLTSLWVQKQRKEHTHTQVLFFLFCFMYCSVPVLEWSCPPRNCLNQAVSPLCKCLHTDTSYVFLINALVILNPSQFQLELAITVLMLAQLGQETNPTICKLNIVKSYYILTSVFLSTWMVL